MCKYACMQICMQGFKYAYMKYVNMQVSKYTSMQVCYYASMNILKYVSIQLCKAKLFKVITRYCQVKQNLVKFAKLCKSVAKLCMHSDYFFLSLDICFKLHETNFLMLAISYLLETIIYLQKNCFL